MLPLIRPARIPTRETSQIAGQWKKKDLLDYVTAIKKKKNNNKISQFHFVNPFSPKSDQHQISPCNINTL